MYTTTSLSFKIKDSTPVDTHRVLEMFFRSWVDEVGDNQVEYSYDHRHASLRVDFVSDEDASILVLRGIPNEFGEYLER